MQFGRKEFFAGLLFAALSTAAISDITSLQASNNSLNPEITFSRQLGLFENSFLTRKALNNNVSENDFQAALSRILYETGISRSFSKNELTAAGIIYNKKPGSVISRKAAGEMLLRSVMFAWLKGSLPQPDLQNEKSEFKDWQPEEKYRPAMAYALKTGLFQGTDGDLFKPAIPLKTREAIVLLKRLHDLFKAYTPSSAMGLFKDVVQEPYMTQPLINLRKAGAFDLTDLNRKLDATGHILVSDLALMFEGMLQRLGNSAYIARIRQIKHQTGHKSASRSNLALMTAILVEAIPHSESDNQVLYSDVKHGSPEEHALNILARAGLRMGYSNNTFSGNETVTRFEAFGLLNRVITELEPVTSLQQTVEKTARTDDVEAFKQKLMARKARIKRILNREPAGG